MSAYDEDARTRLRCVEHLKVSQLLFAEARLKQERGERIEAIELRGEARARRREGLAMLGRTADARLSLRARGAAG
jgi:hypothetical protein